MSVNNRFTGTYKITGDDPTSNIILTADTVTASGNIYAPNLFGNIVGNISGNIIAPGNTGEVLFNDTGAIAALPTLTYDGTSLTADSDMTVTGNLTVSGTAIYANVSTLNVQDPVITMGRGANNAPLTSDDGKDRGEQLWYYTNAEYSSFIGWDNTANKLFAATQVTNTNEVITVNNYGNIVLGNAEVETASATGNVTGGNLNTVGLISATGNVHGGNVLTAGVVSATGNVRGANFNTTGLISAAGNVTASYLIGDGSLLSSITGANVTGTVANATYATSAGSATSATTATTASVVSGNIQSNITSVGNLTSLTVTGNVTAPYFVGNVVGNISGNITVPGNTGEVIVNTSGSAGASSNLIFNGTLLSVVGNVTASYYNGNGSLLSSLTGANVSGTVANATYATSAGTVTTAAQPNITSVGTLTSLTSTGNISTTGNITAGYFIGNGSQLTGLPASYSNTNVAAYLPTYSGNIANLTVTGTLIATTQANTDNSTKAATTAFVQNVLAAAGGYGNAQVSSYLASGTNSANVITTANVSGAYVLGNGSALTSLSGAAVTGTVANAIYATSAGSATTATTAYAVAAGNITGTTLAAGVVTSSLTTVGALNSGSITSGFGAIDIGTDTVTCGGIVNSNANGVGNIGSSTAYFNTVFAKATSAQYADLAEKYAADAEYPVGTVLVIGGDAEVTQSTSYNQTSVAGTVSENPAHVMNDGLQGTTATVALLGRVPCRVVGKINKGDLLATSDFPGVATALLAGEARIGGVVGKALQSYDSTDIGIVEILVGRI